jgi:hypothetical protein
MILEQISGCTEANARAAFDESRRRAHMPLTLASHLISRLSHHHDTTRSKCLALKP